MASRKKQSSRRSDSERIQDFWDKPLSGQKVKRILQRRGFDANAFKKDYLEDRSRVSKITAPSAKTWDTVEVFQKDGDLDALMEKLDLKTPAAANNVIRRVIQYKAQGGKKVIRR